MNDSPDNHLLNQELLELAKTLIKAESISPDDAGCQEVIAKYLTELSFEVEHLPFGAVSNLWATHGHGAPYFVFAGHTDVVPPGPLDQWQTPPFEPTFEQAELRGRGAADMKGSLAAMMTAVKTSFQTGGSNHKGTIAFLITSDEEADAHDGTRKVMDLLGARDIYLDWCLIGEPSSNQQLGDVVRTGRRGSLHGRLKVKGVQGHVAYPAEADNPIHRFAAALHALTSEIWDHGNEFFPPTSLQVSNIHAGTGVTNVIPGELEVVFNFRYSTESTYEGLENRVRDLLDAHKLNYELAFELSGEPFLTVGGELIPAVQDAIRACTGIDPELSTSGGTSDGRFISPTGTQVVELGPRNATIHKVNETVRVEELFALRKIYRHIMEHLTQS